MDPSTSASAAEVQPASPPRSMDGCQVEGLPDDWADAYADVGQWTGDGQLPLVYHNSYNVSFFGTELLSTWDAHKFRKVQAHLVQHGVCQAQQCVAPVEVPDAAALDVHDPAYLTELTTTNWKILQVTETPSLLLMPNALLRWRLLSPLRHHAAGTILAAGLALQHGWAINLGGGMHHAHRTDGRGWCAFDDIMLAVRRVRRASGGRVERILYVDLDAHQGNGVQRDKLHFKDEGLVIVDMYNPDAFPHDEDAKRAIDFDVPVAAGTGDAAYLAKLTAVLAEVRAAGPRPDMVVYNAGVDVLRDEGSGRLALTPEGVVARDELVWGLAQELGVPICMTLGGGYGPGAVDATCRSLVNLAAKFSLVPPQAPPAADAAPPAAAAAADS